MVEDSHGGMVFCECLIEVVSRLGSRRLVIGLIRAAWLNVALWVRIISFSNLPRSKNPIQGNQSLETPLININELLLQPYRSSSAMAACPIVSASGLNITAHHNCGIMPNSFKIQVFSMRVHVRCGFVGSRDFQS